MQEQFFDERSDEWWAGYVYGTGLNYDMVQDRTDEDELYCIEKFYGVWIMIDTKTALEWGL
jgi:hypothetical protein